MTDHRTPPGPASTVADLKAMNLTCVRNPHERPRVIRHVPRPEPQPVGIPPRHQAVAVMLDLVNPSAARGRASR
jgi:hypothetical protein